MSDMGQMDANLMGTPGFQPAAHQRHKGFAIFVPAEFFLHLKMRDRFASLGIGRVDSHVAVEASRSKKRRV